MRKPTALAALLILAGCDRATHPTGISGRKQPPAVKVQALAVAQFSSDADITLTLFDDCTWKREAEEAPHLGEGHYGVTDDGERILLDPGRSLMRWHGGHRRSWEDPDVFYDEDGVSWHWERRRPGTVLPAGCYGSRPLNQGSD